MLQCALSLQRGFESATRRREGRTKGIAGDAEDLPMI